MLNSNISILSGRFRIQRGLVFGALIITALLAFELFNYSTTDFALTDLLGDLRFLGISWATILSIAFCGIDFAGIARLFTPEQGSDEPAEVWYLFGAWMLAAVMNAMLTWWGVSIAVLNHQTLGNAVVARVTLLRVVPIFVAVMVWLIRVLIIGTISMAGDRLFSQANIHRTARKPKQQSTQRRAQSNNSQNRSHSIRPLGNSSSIRRGVSASPNRNASRGGSTSSYQPSPKPQSQYTPDQVNSAEPEYIPMEPTYAPVSFSGNQNGNNSRQNRF